MKTSKELEVEFKAKLKALLYEYGAVLTAKDHWNGYAECGEDVRMTVEIPAVYSKDYDYISEMTDIDLGTYFAHDSV